jgi:hypothetical protein
MNNRKQPAPITPAGRQRPLYTRKSAWKLGWPPLLVRLQEPARPEPAAG